MNAPLTVANRRVGYGADAASQLRFAAQLSRNPKGAKVFVDHGPTPGLGASIEAEVRNLVTQVPDARGVVLAAEQFYAHVPVDGLQGRAQHFYQWRTDDGFVSDVLSTHTAMPSTRDAMGPFRFTMMGDQGIDDTPALPPGLPRGVYDDAHYSDDDAPAVPHTDNVLRQIIAARPDFHVLAGDIAYADPSGMGRKPTFMPSKANPPNGFDKFNPFVWDVYLGSIEASAAAAPWNGVKQNEAVAWSRVRLANYAFLRVDVRPGTLVSEMDVTAVDEYGREFDKLTYRRPVRT